MGVWDGSGISCTMCKQSAPRSRQTTTLTPSHHSIFTGRVLFPTPSQQPRKKGRWTGVCAGVQGRWVKSALLTVRSISTMYTRHLTSFLGEPITRTMRSVDIGQHDASTFTSTPKSWRISRSFDPALPMTQPACDWWMSILSSGSSWSRRPPCSVPRFYNTRSDAPWLGR